MKYEIKKVEKNYLDVEYEDGATATIRFVKDDTKTSIQTQIKQFATKEEYSDSSSVPLKVGDTGDTSTEDAGPIWTYGSARAQNYPPRGDQLDALYWSRKGDSSHQTKIDEAIADTKTKWPKTLGNMTQAEYDAKVKELYG
tara:strand:- start:583 stop:1005 length:423 start_codon:yes stop_codon:yes gene_type:complete